MAQLDELKELQELIDRCCIRPEMYVGYRSIERIGTFVWAYAAGRSYGNSLNLLQYIRLFSFWIASKHKTARNVHWPATLLEIHDQDEERSLADAPNQFSNFIQECGQYTKKEWFERIGPVGAWNEAPWSTLPV